MGYTKLFSSLITSTVWKEDDKTRIVWITMLALKNERHIVEASIPGLADVAHVSIDDALAAIEKLSKPDKWSRTKEHDGRRIEPVTGGWRIINGEFYRNLMSKEERAEYHRIYQREYRKRKKDIRTAAATDGEAKAWSEGMAAVGFNADGTKM